MWVRLPPGPPSSRTQVAHVLRSTGDTSTSVSRMTRLALVLALCLPAALLSAEEAERTVEDLLKSMRASDYQTRRRAVLAVKGRSESPLLERVLELAEKDPHQNIRAYAAEVLADSQDERVFHLLARMVAKDDYGPRTKALIALGQQGDPRAYGILLDHLKTRNAAYAVKGLGLLGDTRAFEPVRKAYLAGLKDAYMSEFGPTALLALDAQAAETLLLDVLNEGEGHSRWSIARALQGRPTKRVRDAMLSHLASEDEKLRHLAIGVLGHVGGDRETDALLQHFETKEKDRAWVAAALGEMKAKDATPTLITLLESESVEERASAAKALARIRDARSLRPLLKALGKEPEARIRVRMLEALGRLGDERAVSSLVPLLDDDSYSKQPMRFSRILPWPWNTQVSTAALWALRTILDGKVPVGPEALTSFPDPRAPAWVKETLPAFRRWWEAHKGEARYHFAK